MAAKPDANNSQVAGSGTVPGDPLLPQGPVFFFFPLALASTAIPSAPFFFFTGPQRPSGKGGGESEMKFPPPNGLAALTGPTGARPGTSGRFSKADSNAAGGPCMAVLSPARIGSP